MNSDLKTCRICSAEKAASDFYLRQNGKLQNACKACLRARRDAHYAANRDGILKAARARYAANPEVSLAQSKSWYQNNHERARASRKAWANEHATPAYYRERYLCHRDDKLAQAKRRRAALTVTEKARARELDRQWRQRNPERTAAYREAWAAKNPERLRLRSANYRARKALADGNLSFAEWEQIKDDFGQRCAYCLAKQASLEVEHMVPLARGGRHDLGNVVPACRSCNGAKSTKTPLEFLQYQLVP